MGWLIISGVSCYALARTIRDGLGKAAPADLLALALALIGIAQGVASRQQDLAVDAENRGRALAAQLARQVLNAETPQFRQLVGGDNHRINLAFIRSTDDVRPAFSPHAAGRLYVPPEESTAAAVPDVRTFYQSTHPKRLLVTGDAGAGKTALALELLLALIDDRREDDPVPVRMGLAQYDTRVSMEQNITSHLMVTYNWRRDRAKELVAQGRVLPVLDGLDEMDSTAPGENSTLHRQRALILLDCLNAYQRGRDLAPVVLTCRTAHYDAVPRQRRLRDATRVALAPVDSDKACEYLAGRAIDRQSWQPILDGIRRTPTSALATTLSNPWRLSLAATVFAHDGDPAELLGHRTAGDLDAFLLARLIPASTGLAAGPRRYAPAEVHRWLSDLAAYHHEQEASTDQGSGPRVDMVLHQIWPMAGTLLPRVIHALVVIAGVAAFSDFVMGGLDKSLVLYSGLLSLPAVRIGLKPESNPKRFASRRLLTRRGLRQAAIGLAFGVPVAVGVGLIFALVAALVTDGFDANFLPRVGEGFGFGLLVAPAASLYLGFNRGLSDTLTPQDPLRNDLRFGLSFGLVFWLCYGAAFWPVYRLIYRWQNALGVAPLFETSHIGGRRLSLLEQYREHGPTYGFSSGTTADVLHTFHVAHATEFACVAGLLEALVFGCAIGAGAWTRYAIAVTITSIRSGLPLRLGTFLDWAYQAGILRVSGISYQFRHLELQSWLVHHRTDSS